MTSERALYYGEGTEFWRESIRTPLSMHMLKFHEILDASKEKLPHLGRIELVSHIYCWEDILVTRIKSTIKDRAILVKLGEFNIDYEHDFQRR